MRNSFKEYYGLTSSELERLWGEGLIVFDTNVLLSLYRRPEDFRNDFISVIRRLKDRVWIPHQVGYEFHEHRLEKAMRPVEDVKAIKGKLQKFKNEIEQEYGSNPYLDNKKINQAFNSFLSRLDKIVQTSLKSCPDFLKEDGILTMLTELLEGKIGPAYQEKKLAEIYRIGGERYSNDVPPGYKDSKKTDGDRHRFGDLIIWMQIIEHAKTEAKDIIFVTDDKKEDWWEEYKGNLIGPRRELIREFCECANNQSIWFYTLERFLEYAKSKVHVSIKNKTIEEVKKPAIVWTLKFGQSTLPGQVSLDSKWPSFSLGESDSIDIRLSARDSYILDKTPRLFSSRNSKEIWNADLREPFGLGCEGLALSGIKEEAISGGLDEGNQNESRTPKPSDNDSDNNQDKGE